jgi:hypothetical protein
MKKFGQGNLLGNVDLEDRGGGIWITLAVNNILKTNEDNHTPVGFSALKQTLNVGFVSNYKSDTTHIAIFMSKKQSIYSLNFLPQMHSYTIAMKPRNSTSDPSGVSAREAAKHSILLRRVGVGGGGA